MHKSLSTLNLAVLQLLAAAAAAALWYVWPAAGAWPLLLAILPWLVNVIIGKRPLLRTPFDWPILLFLVTGLLAVWSAYDKDVAWAKFWLIIGGVLLFYAFANWIQVLKRAQTPYPEQPAWVLAFFGTAVAIYFIFTHDWDAFAVKFAGLAALGHALQSFAPVLPGHRLNPNVAASMLLLALPFGIVTVTQAWQKRTTAVFLVGLLSCIIMLMASMLTTSRGAWAALIIGSIIILTWQCTRLLSRKAAARRYYFLLLLSVGFLIIIAFLLLRPQILQQLIALTAVSATGSSRLDLIRNSIVLVQDYPFIGSGLGSFMMVYSTYALLTHVGYIVNAHNLYLDVAIEQGLIALAALVWMWLIFGRLLWREMGAGHVRPLLAAAATALLLILMHGLVEDTYFGSRALLLFLLPLAFVMDLPAQEIMRANSGRWLLPAAGLGVALVLAIVVLRPLRAAVYANLAAVQQSRAELSVYSWPEWPLQDEVRRQLTLSDAVENYENALAFNPANASANRRLGQIELSLGAYENALTHLEAAYATMPWDNTTKQLYGEALIVNGRLDAGRVLWSDINQAQGQLDARVFWYGQLDAAEKAAWIQQVRDQVAAEQKPYENQIQ